MHYSSMGVEGGGVTTFGIIVNAVVTVTLIPSCVVIWGAPAAAQAESVSHALPLQLATRVPDGDVPSTTPTDVASLPLTVPSADTAGDVSAQLPATPTPTEQAVEMPEEQRIRLARFLPKLDTGAVPPLDNLLAKAFTVRSSRQQNGGGAVHVYRSGRQVTPATGVQEGEASSAASMTKEDAPEGEAEAAQLLDAGDALLAQSQISDAFLTYFEIVNTYPDSAASLEVDAALNGLLWDADRGIADTTVLRALADQLPAYDECASDKAVYWLTALQQATGSALKRSGQLEAAVPYLQTGRDLALAVNGDRQL